MSMHATLNGNITDIGGVNCDERGFDWDYDSGPPYANSWTETNSYGIGAFSHQITGLTEGATVYFRAKAHNTEGWGYGAEKSFVASTTLIGWYKRVKLTIDHNDIDSALSDFPILIHLGTSVGRNSDDVSCVFDELLSDDNRKKIAVTLGDGTTECYVEIEKWDDASEEAWLWVKVPDISADVDTELYLYYSRTHADNDAYVGDPGSTPAKNVWDSHFKGVWHLNDIPIPTPIRSDLLTKNTTTYDAFGLVLKTGTNTFMYFARMGTTHMFDKGKIVKITYDAVSHTWGDFSDVYEDPTYDSRNVGGGIIGNHIFIFFGRNDYTLGEVWKDIGYVKSTDLTGTSWGPYTPIDVSPLEAYSPYGNMVNVDGVYYQPFYGWYPHPIEASTTFCLKLFKSIDNGASWTVGPTIYSGSEIYSETACGYIGNNKLIAIVRNQTTYFLRQFTSSDGGDTWTDRGDTNLGEADHVQVPFVQVKDDRILLFYGDTYDFAGYMSDSKHADVFNNPTNWAARVQIAWAEVELWHVYPSLAHWKDDIWVCVWATGPNTNDVDTHTRQYKRVVEDVADSTVNENKGASSGGMDASNQVSAQVDGGLDLDGVDDRVSVSDSPSLSAVSPFTIEILFKRHGTGDEGLASKDDGAGGHREWALVFYPTNVLDFFLFSSAAANYLEARGSTVMDTGQHYTAATWDGVNDIEHIKLRLDGAEETLGEDNKVGTGCVPHDTATPVEIGRYYGSNTYCFDGILDEVRISDVVREAAWLDASRESALDDLLGFGSEEVTTIPIAPGLLPAMIELLK